MTQNLTLYLEPGYWSHVGSRPTQIFAGGQVTVNFGTVIENAKGGKAGDIIFGNAADNSIWGFGGQRHHLRPRRQRDWSLYSLEYQMREGSDLSSGQLAALTATVGVDTAALVSLIGQVESGALF